MGQPFFMTEPKKKPVGTTKPKAVKAKVAKKPTKPKADKATVSQKEIGKTGRQVYSQEVQAAARALWEGDPKKTKREVAAEVGIAYGTIDRWSKGNAGKTQRWIKQVANMTPRVKKIAEDFKGRMSELGPGLTDEQKEDVHQEVGLEAAAQLRAKVLDRHRKEWEAPRRLFYEAIKNKDFNQMKMGKITSEGLKIIQDGERKAWGIDTGPDGSTTVHVTIERG